jgi:hypothetical protein
MGKFKEMDLLRQEREAFDADYPLPPPPHWGDLWVAWNSEDGFTFWEDEQQAIRWSAADSNEYPVQYVMQKAQPAPVQEPVAWIITFEKQNGDRETCAVMGRYKDVKASCDFGDPIPLYTTPPAAQPAPWVGLTPDDIRQLEKENTVGGYYGDYCPTWDLIEAVEAKLKEKNRG